MATICTGTQYTQRINRSECIGNSLVTINDNFKNLDEAACELNNDVIEINNNIGGVSPLLCGFRLSLDPNSPVPTNNRIGTFANTLWLHPYNGSLFSLYDNVTNNWNSFRLTGPASVSLAGLAADRNHDIYLYKNASGTVSLEIQAWPANHGPGGAPPTRQFQDNVIVKSGDPTKRFVGCLRTTEVAGQSEQSFMGYADGGFHSRQYLWNAQSKINVMSAGFDIQEYTITGLGPIGDTGIRRANQATASNAGRNNRFSFIVGDTTGVDVVGQIYPQFTSSPNQIITHCVFGVNEETDPYATTIGNYAQLVGETRGSDSICRAHLKSNFNPGYHYIQLFERVQTGATGTVVNMNQGPSTSGININTNKTGLLANLTI